MHLEGMPMTSGNTFNTKKIAIGCIVIGLLLPLINLTVISGLASEGVVDGVQDTIATPRGCYLTCEDVDGDGIPDSKWLGHDWLVSTSERTYFANNIINLDNLSSGVDELPELEMMGPFIYTVTTTKEVLNFDEEGGTITYSEYDSFEWCSSCVWNDDDGVGHSSVPGDTEVSQINILWNTQLIAGIATGIGYGETFAKAGFANAMITNDIVNRAPSIWASESIGASNDLVGAENVLGEAYNLWNASGGGSMAPDFTSSVDAIMHSAVGGVYRNGKSVCIALTCDIGPMLVAGMGAPSTEITEKRSELYGYSDVPEPERTHIDWAVYALAGGAFVSAGGGIEDVRNATDLRERLVEVSGVDIANPVVLDYVLFGIAENGLAAGLMTVTDFQGIPLNGAALFLLGAQSNAFGTMEEYGTGLTQLLGLADWAGAWIGMLGVPAEFEMILVGNSGLMDADLWWQNAFGGVEPIEGGYLSIGLNRANYEGTVDIGTEKAKDILYDSNYALTSTFSTAFMYGEISGHTLPTGAEGFEMGGAQAIWDDAYVAGIYEISESDASALRSWVKDFMFPQVVPALLNFQYSATPYTTQSMNNWLYGWSDSVLAGIYSQEESWVTLETNETYYGSGGMSTGDYTVYMMSTGTGANNADNMEHGILRGFINSDGDGMCDFKLDEFGVATYDVSCEANETYGMTEFLPWRAPHNEAATYGLLTDNVGNNKTSWADTIGGIADAKNSFSVNLVGYAIAESEVGDEVTYKDIPMIEHSIRLNPSEHQIQGKLIGSGTFVDAMPGALPVYFGSEVDIKVEPITNVAMYGKSTSTFYFDYRGPGNLDPDFNADYVKPVFEIHTFAEIPDEDAVLFKGLVLDHMGPFFWTDLGGSGDTDLESSIFTVMAYVSALMYIGGLVMIVAGAMQLGKIKEDVSTQNSSAEEE